MMIILELLLICHYHSCYGKQAKCGCCNLDSHRCLVDTNEALSTVYYGTWVGDNCNYIRVDSPSYNT